MGTQADIKTELVTTTKGQFWCFVGDKITESVKTPKGLEQRYPLISQQFIHSGDICLDVGANIGTFSVLIARLVGSDGRVFAFEPFEQTRQLLAKNLQLNDVANIVKIQSQVISDRINSYGSRLNSKNMGATRFQENKNNSEDNNLESNFTSTTLDFWIRDRSEIQSLQAIKIDVEGMEIKVIQGATELLKKYQPILYIEVCKSQYKNYGFNIEDLEKILQDFGYHFFREFKPFPCRDRAFRRLFSLSQGSPFYDLLAIHPDNPRYPQQYSGKMQAFTFMLGEKLNIFWNTLRAKYRVRTRIKSLIGKP